jgi:hypothetical protein
VSDHLGVTGSLAGLGAAQLGVVALCAAGAAGGDVVCSQVGWFTGALPCERPYVAWAASADHTHRGPRSGSSGWRGRPHRSRTRSGDRRLSRRLASLGVLAIVLEIVCGSGEH